MQGSCSGKWCESAVRIVDELLVCSSSEAADDLLDFRNLLVGATDWEAVLDQFLKCRVRYEADHYLPYYRLRILLSGSLRLEASTLTGGGLRDLLRWRFPSFLALQRYVLRDCYEHCEEAGPIRIVEVVEA